MTNEALNKVQQTHPLFKKITASLNKLLGISFGHMKVFKDRSYYTLMDDLECLTKFVTHVEKSSIFCERNVTNFFDGDYNFTLWPKVPCCTAMEIYHQHGIWNGITVSKINKDYVELYWFTQKEAEDDWHRFFIRNKQLLLQFINYFRSYKEALNLPENNIDKNLFKFRHDFDIDLVKSEYTKKDSPTISRLLRSLRSDPMLVDNLQVKTNLSPREIEVLSIICHGYTAKVAAQQLDISARTIQEYIIRIKQKTRLHFKTELIELYEKEFHKN